VPNITAHIMNMSNTTLYVSKEKRRVTTMAHSEESGPAMDPFAGVSDEDRYAMFDIAYEQGLEGEALATEYHRLLRLLTPRPLADLALAKMQEVRTERLAGLVANTVEETYNNPPLSVLDEIEQTRQPED
jgi:hypothetical protein